MEVEKYGNSGSLSKVMKEVDDVAITPSDSESESDDNTGVGRTYECSYCKRGFTNAQALGGHMNIHRKDKAKAKQLQQQQQQQQQSQPSFYTSSFSYKYDEGFSPYTPNTLGRERNHHYGMTDFYQPFYPFTTTFTSSQPSIYGASEFSSGRSRLFGMYEEHLGADLSLRMSSCSTMVSSFNHGDQENKNEDNCSGAIDLELRLGYDS